MPDDFVHVGRQLARHAAPFFGARGLFRRPRELAAEFDRRRAVVGIVHVRERHGLAPELLADILSVGQVDADRRDRARVAGLHDHVDGIRGNTRDTLLAVFRVPRHPVLEPLRVSRELADLGRLFRVHVVDQRLPRALHPAGIHVDLDESVNRIDRRRLVLNPGDVVRRAIGSFAGLIELHEGFQRFRHRLGRKRHGSFEMADDRADLRVVPSRRPGRPLRRACRSPSPAANSTGASPRSPPRPSSSRRHRGCSRSTPGCPSPRQASCS